MLEEFKKFALRGNAVDLAIGVIIGAAFGAIALLNRRAFVLWRPTIETRLLSNNVYFLTD